MYSIDMQGLHKHHTCISQCQHAYPYSGKIGQRHTARITVTIIYTTHKICDQGGEGGERTSSGRTGRSGT